MSKLKYPKDENGNSILGIQNGITITRPWSKEMYEHNEKVADKMKEKISLAIDVAYDSYDSITLELIGKALNGHGYGSGYKHEDLYLSCLQGLKNVQNHWLHSDVWSDLVKEDIVKPIEIAMVGYDKLK